MSSIWAQRRRRPKIVGFNKKWSVLGPRAARRIWVRRRRRPKLVGFEPYFNNKLNGDISILFHWRNDVSNSGVASFDKNGKIIKFTENLNLGYALNQAQVVGYALKLSFFPINLIFDYNFPNNWFANDSYKWLPVLFWLSLVTIIIKRLNRAYLLLLRIIIG